MILVDTSAWFASVVPSDVDHAAASGWLAVNREALITTDYGPVKEQAWRFLPPADADPADPGVGANLQCSPCSGAPQQGEH